MARWLTTQEREQREQEQAFRRQMRAVKAFRKTLFTKDLLYHKTDSDGFTVFTYENGQGFKCRGPLPENAGLL